MKRRRLKNISICLCLLLAAVLAWRFTGCDFAYFASRAGHLGDLITQMFPPDTAYFANILSPLLITVRMAATGTVLGSLLALIIAPLCAANIGFNTGIRIVLRIIVQVLRSFPALILALFATFIFGIGTFAGTFALTLFTFAIMTRLTYEDIEASAGGAFKALAVIGTGRTVNFYRTIFPQILPSFLTNALYLLETNVRHSSILGYVGAGGIGILLNEKVSWREYSRVGTILLALFIIVCAAEWLSSALSAIVRGEKNTSERGKKLIAAAFAIVFIISFAGTGLPDFSHTAWKIVENMADGFIHPDLEFFFGTSKTDLGRLILETIAISYLGTLFGTIPALLLAFLNSPRIVKRAPALIFRIIIMMIRSVPFVIYGLIIIRVTGAGAFAGVLTMGVCSIGLLSKRFTEAIDALDMRAYRALRNMGVSAGAAVCRAILPQLWPVIASSILYRFDVNFREASVLGLVGAGGIGTTLILAMNKYMWSTVGAIFIGMVIMVWLIDIFSGFLRRSIQK